MATPPPKLDVFFSGSPLALGPPQIDNRSATGPLSKILGLSPSLFSSPGKGLPAETLEDSSLYLTQGEHAGLDLVHGSHRKHGNGQQVLSPVLGGPGHQG